MKQTISIFSTVWLWRMPIKKEPQLKFMSDQEYTEMLRRWKKSFVLRGDKPPLYPAERDRVEAVTSSENFNLELLDKVRNERSLLKLQSASL